MLLSRGNVSTMVFLKNRDRYHYDSFIFGSSRATAFTAKEWSKYLPAKSQPFSFEAWNENLSCIYKRLKLLDSLNVPIKNTLIILDVDRAFEYFGDITADHYLIRNDSKFEYYKKDYLYYVKTPHLFISSVDYAIFKKQRSYMNGFVGMKNTDIDPINNDWFPLSEQEIQHDTAAYYKDTEWKFYKRPIVQQYSYGQLNAKQISYLMKIAALFRKHHTNYKIVISPLYSQKQLSKQDLRFMKTIFKADNVHDYSGINAITNNQFNYCNDVIHYRKKVGNIIMRELYNKSGEASPFKGQIALFN
ncbi:hypothetical protein [Mucilaginibacter gilvus]|uniref:Uncharacterized protein n=1 Tax=Mucilaginibacter gilvus TaxID=2305909 RepID=A0A444MLN1_9SPHI|nr:hypothetical protein [Mucilaginibacter gilvus]RWY50215.1 hypothetical protein EPL05_15820 [Mucilaginibacter gilvus]